jgi:hypothetical protein
MKVSVTPISVKNRMIQGGSGGSGSGGLTRSAAEVDPLRGNTSPSVLPTSAGSGGGGGGGSGGGLTRSAAEVDPLRGNTSPSVLPTSAAVKIIANNSTTINIADDGNILDISPDEVCFSFFPTLTPPSH